MLLCSCCPRRVFLEQTSHNRKGSPVLPPEKKPQLTLSRMGLYRQMSTGSYKKLGVPGLLSAILETPGSETSICPGTVPSAVHPYATHLLSDSSLSL